MGLWPLRGGAVWPRCERVLSLTCSLVWGWGRVWVVRLRCERVPSAACWHLRGATPAAL